MSPRTARMSMASRWRQQLCMDLRRRSPGARYTTEKCARNRIDLDTSSLLIGLSLPVTVASVLMRAVLATKRARPDHAVLMVYLGKAFNPLNHTNLIGYLKWILSIRASCETQIGSALSLLRYAAHTKRQESHPEEFDIMSECWDSALFLCVELFFMGPFGASGARVRTPMSYAQSGCVDASSVSVLPLAVLMHTHGIWLFTYVGKVGVAISFY